MSKSKQCQNVYKNSKHIDLPIVDMQEEEFVCMWPTYGVSTLPPAPSYILTTDRLWKSKLLLRWLAYSWNTNLGPGSIFPYYWWTWVMDSMLPSFESLAIFNCTNFDGCNVRAALLSQWNLDNDYCASIQKGFAVFLLYSRVEA